MTKFIFHGGGVDPVTNSNDSFYEELVKDLDVSATVLLVYFASRSDDYSDRVEFDTAKLKEHSQVIDLHILVATHENFLEEVSFADAVYLRGGSTEKLLKALRNYPNLKESFSGKTIAGSSAGAYALSTYFSSHYEDLAENGLGIVPVRVATHIGSKTMPPRLGAVTALENMPPDLELIELREGEWKVVIAK